MAIYNAIWTPLTVSFDYAIELSQDSNVFITIDWIVLAIFTTDIIIQFMTSYLIVESGEIVNKPSYIAMNYLKTYDFYIDFLSTFPFEAFGKLVNLSTSEGYITFSSLMKILKVLRIRKLGILIQNLPNDTQTKASLKIVYYAFLVLIALHTFACMLWFSLKTENQWVAPTDFGAIRSRQGDPYT